MAGGKFTITMKRLRDMQFVAKFDKEQFEDLMLDEPENVPGGRDEYPNASRILAVAITNCLSASLTFCLEKAHNPLDDLEATTTVHIDRNEKGYWRVRNVDVELTAGFDQLDEKTMKKFEKCKERFFNYCIVSASIKEGIDINVKTTAVQKS